MRQGSGPTGSKLGHKTCNILIKGLKACLLNRQEQNARIYHLPEDKAGVTTSIRLEAKDVRDRKMSFDQPIM